MKVFLSILSFILLSFSGYSQSESNDMINYDTTIQLKNSTDGSLLSNHYLVHITRPRNYFTANNIDTTSRPIIVTHHGLLEVQTGAASDTNIARLYGPAYWQSNGWDGGVMLGNGKHYPILITVIPPVQSVPPPYVLSLYRTLKAAYHPRGGRFLCEGLSQGGYHISSMIIFSNGVTGNQEGMNMVKAYVDLQGVGADRTSTDWPIPGGFGTWASTGGKFFALEGTADTRNLWQISQAMNSVVSNTGYFSYENDGSTPGSHCCWNDFYNPSQVDWRNNPKVNNPYIVTNTTNTPGTYAYDAINGTNVWQWLLRQGDTTLIGGCAPIVTANSKVINLPTNSVKDTGIVTYQCGNLVGTTTWSQVSGPSTSTIFPSSSLITTFSNLIAGTYTFALTVVDNASTTTTKNITITVNATVSPNVTAGSNQTVILPTTSCTLTGTSSGNNGASITLNTWSLVSGPNTPTIVTPNNRATTVNGFIQGVYVFNFKATDDNGNSNNVNTTVTVTPAGTSLIARTRYFPGEYQGCKIGKDSVGYTYSSSLVNIGTGNAGIPGVLNRYLVPAGTKMKTAVSGLHSTCFVTIAGDVYAAGDNSQGQLGIGNTVTPQYTPIKLTRDSIGNAFTNISYMVAGFAGNISQVMYYVKTDGTLWASGDLECGMRGDGTFGGISSYPVQLTVPGNKKVIQILSGLRTTILLDDSTVWITGGANSPGNAPPYSTMGYVGTGNDYLSWHQVIVPGGGVTQLAGGDICQYALTISGKLYGWGFRSGYLGDPSNVQYATPTDLTTNITSKLPFPINQIVTNSNSTHAILTDSTLWGWGDNGQGAVGNGVETNMATLSTPYQLDPSLYLVLPQYAPVKLTNKHNWVSIYGSSTFTFYTYAVDANDSVYSWGRNKGGVLNNGIDPCGTGGIASNYSNAWDVTRVTLAKPWLTAATLASCPLCFIGTNNTTSPCNECSLTQGIAAAVISNQSFNTINISLDGSGSNTTSGVVISYLWSLVSGPNTPTLEINTGPKINVFGLVNGTYTFSLTVMDSNFVTSTKQFTVTIGNASNCNCLILNGIVH